MCVGAGCLGVGGGEGDVRREAEVGLGVEVGAGESLRLTSTEGTAFVLGDARDPNVPGQGLVGGDGELGGWAGVGAALLVPGGAVGGSRELGAWLLPGSGMPCRAASGPVSGRGRCRRW
ncbi:hypothetical protein Stsp01_63420 [Streptomyces sp. NBRC 13847]|nr:hypothetical protein Stsp01_63420 [Streptomyces sp. NBRC 13847]